MAERRLRAQAALGGELAAWLATLIPAAVWSPKELRGLIDRNPFREAGELSEAMREHLAGWEREKLKAAVGG
jgi:hypothetical protein